MKTKIGSRYNISIPLHQGRRVVFNSLSMAMAVWTAEESAAFDKICDGGQDQVDEPTINGLLYGGFVVSEDVDEVEALEKMYIQQRFNYRQVILTIAPTMACNFKCDYCFQGQDKPHQTMKEDVQDAIIEMVERSAPNMDQLGVTWYGGEPLLRPKVIESLSKRMISACEANGVKYSGSVVTNGYKLNVETARMLYEQGVTWMQITLDGTPEYHDTRRYLLGGQGSFERIVENLQNVVDEFPIGYSIRVNVDERNHKDIHKLIDYLEDAGLAGKDNFGMYFAPIEALTEGCHNVQDVTMTKSAYGELEAKLYRHGHKVGLTPLPFPPRFHGICGAVRPSSLVILPTGDLHKCWDTVSWPLKKIGTIFNTAALAESELMMRWLKWSPFENETCRNCKILPNCAGACAYKFIHAEDTRGEAAVLPCPSWKYNINERLLQRAVAMGKITDSDYDSEAVKTNPAELCADHIIEGGQALPAEMQRYYNEQKNQKKTLLPVVE